MKYSCIFHVTTACNFDCSYCDVIKDKQMISSDTRDHITHFIKNNKSYIESFKFFWWEPLLAWKDIEHIITQNSLPQKYWMVTNTSLLRDELGEYLQKHFSTLFFSIDSENDFDFIRIQRFIEKYNLEKQVYFNLIISPGKEADAYKNFSKLYSSGMRGFNILPVYFTQAWSKTDLKNLSAVMKSICDKASREPSLRLYGFQENSGYDSSLFNHVIFIDIDGSMYYSDIVSTFYGQDIKQEMYLWHISYTSLQDLEKVDFSKKKEIIHTLEEQIYQKVSGQKQLHELMDYFSTYMNHG